MGPTAQSGVPPVSDPFPSAIWHRVKKKKILPSDPKGLTALPLKSSFLAHLTCNSVTATGSSSVIYESVFVSVTA